MLSPGEVSADADGGCFSANAVAGTRINLPNREIPITINVATEELLRDLQLDGIRSCHEAIRSVPGVMLRIVDRTFIRGFSSPQFRDGMPHETELDMLRIQRVEGFKRASALSDGLAEPGGSVNVVTKSARLEGADLLETFFSVGSWGRENANLDFNYCMIDSNGVPMAFRLVACGDHVDKLRGFAFTAGTVTTCGPRVKLGVGGNTTARLRYFNVEREGAAFVGMPIRERQFAGGVVTGTQFGTDGDLVGIRSSSPERAGRIIEYWGFDALAETFTFCRDDYCVTHQIAMFENRLRFVFGVRRHEYARDCSNRVSGVGPSTYNAQLQRLVEVDPQRGRVKLTATTPQFGTSFDNVPNVWVFGPSSESITLRHPAPFTVASLPATSGEGLDCGVKCCQCWNGRLDGTVSFFAIEKQSIPRVDLNAPPGQTIFVLSGRERARGGEFDLFCDVTEDRQFTLGCARVSGEIVSNVQNRAEAETGWSLIRVAKDQVKALTEDRFASGPLLGLSAVVGGNSMGDRPTFPPLPSMPSKT